MVRRQLTLFVPPAGAVALEALRRTLDPLQAALIAAHVTLAREDELEGLGGDALAARFAAAAAAPLALGFGAPVPFGGHGWLLECEHGQAGFTALRECVLGGRAARTAHAHLTLAHPRNPRAAGNTAESAGRWPAGFACTFADACWIEQSGGSPWRVLRRFALASL